MIPRRERLRGTNPTTVRPCGRAGRPPARPRSPQHARTRAAPTRAAHGRAGPRSESTPRASRRQRRAARLDDPRELVEERDHVVQRHEIEAVVGERQRGRIGRPRSARARSRRAARLRDHPARDVDPGHLRARRSARPRAARPRPLPVPMSSTRGGGDGSASSAAAIGASSSGRRASRPTRARAGRKCASAAGGRAARARRADDDRSSRGVRSAARAVTRPRSATRRPATRP